MNWPAAFSMAFRLASRSASARSVPLPTTVTVTRLPGVLGGEGATEEESFQTELLEYPHYTRPRVFEGYEVPAVLLEGDHGRVARWRRQESLRRTLAHRPDLLAKTVLSKADREFLRLLAETPPEDK